MQDFTYLGAKVSADGRMDKEITNRLQKGGKFYQSVRHLLWDKEVPGKAKMVMYNTYYTPIITYVAETWTMSEKSWSRIQAGEMKFLRGVVGKSRKDRIRNVDIRREVGVRSLREKIGRNQMRWYGHVKRMSEERIPKRMEEMQEEGRRPRGRPRGRWKDGIRRVVESKGGNWMEVQREEIWKDRRRWRGLVDAQTR